MTSNSLQAIFIAVLWFALASAVSLDLSGCANSPSAARNAAQVIVKFAPGVSEPTNAAYLADLSRSAGVRVGYARPMSGGAHVLTLSGYGDEASLVAAIKALEARADIEYVELDRKQRPSGKTQ